MIKKYKKVKRRFNQALNIISHLKSELEKYRFDNNDFIRFDEIQNDLDLSRKSNSKVR